MSEGHGLRRLWRRHRKLLIAWTLVGMVFGGGLAWYLDKGRHLFFPKNWGEVVPGRVWRSGQIHGRIVEDVLRDNQIEVVVDLARDDPDNQNAEVEREAVRRLGIRKVDLIGLGGDGTGWVEDYVVALREMVTALAADRRLLLHCAAGSERTGGVVACYRMLYEGWDGQRAWTEYRSYRKKPPKKDALPRFVNGNLPTIVRRLQESGHLQRAPDPLPRFGPPDTVEAASR